MILKFLIIKINQLFFIFNIRELSENKKRLTSLNLSGTKLEEPYTRPPSCTTPGQLIIYQYLCSLLLFCSSIFSIFFFVISFSSVFLFFTEPGEWGRGKTVKGGGEIWTMSWSWGEGEAQNAILDYFVQIINHN